MAQTLPDPSLKQPLIAPTEEVWRGLSTSEREELLIRILDAHRRDEFERMPADLKARAEAAQERHAQAQERLAQAQEQLTQAQEQAARAQEQLTHAQEQAAQALSALREGIAALLGARALVLSDEARARLSSCSDAATLQRWLIRATSVGSLEEVFAP